MSEDAEITRADATQLQRWAFGRAESDADRERAAAALAELARRDADARSAASAEHPVAVSPPQVSAVGGGAPPSLGSLDSALADAPDDDAALEAAEPVEPAAARHRRRMLTTGIAGALTALLVAPIVGALLTLPDPDPLAIFESPASSLDEEWSLRLQQVFLTTPTLGPRVVEANGLTLVAFRASTVPDGRSTEWDAYCMASMPSEETTGETTESPEFSNLMLNCVHAQRFDESGIAWVTAGNSTGDGFEVVQWGPTGPPRVEQVETLDIPPDEGSALDWMAYPNPVDDATRLLDLVNEPERLLMGPSAFFIADESGTLDVELALYLLAPRSPSDELELCLAATARRSPTATGCRPLSEAIAEGLLVYAPAEEGGWNVVISPDGSPTVERTGVVLD